MRNLFKLIALSLVTVLVLVACTSDDGTDDASDDTDSSGSAVEDVTEEPATDDATDDEADDAAETPEESPATDDAATPEDTETETDDATSDDATPDDAADDTADDATTTPETSTDDSATETSDSGSDTGDVSGNNVLDVTQSEQGDITTADGTITFVVYDAGEVEIQLDGQQLSLVEVRPNDGWDFRTDDDDDDDIEVDFRQPGREIDFDAEIESNQLKIEIDNEWDDAEDGVYSLGLPGEVEFTRDGERVTLVEVRPTSEWDYSVEEDDGEEIEVDFRRGPDEAEFDAEVDDGRLEVTIQLDLHFDLE